MELGMTVTVTRGPLHFEDLHPLRFEDLCLGLMYRLRRWHQLEHVGRAGADGGVDIVATELLDDGVLRRWGVQCRQYSKSPASVLKKALDDVLAGSGDIVDVVLVVVACSPSRKAREALVAYAKKRGVNDVRLWSASELEASLYSDRSDLLLHSHRG